MEDRRWRILSHYFKPIRQGTPNALRTDAWLSRRLESALFRGVGLTAILPLVLKTTRYRRSGRRSRQQLFRSGGSDRSIIIWSPLRIYIAPSETIVIISSWS